MILNTDFISFYSTVCRLFVSIALIVPIFAIIKEMRSQDGLNTFRYLILSFLFSMGVGRLSLSFFQYSKIVTETTPIQLTNLATLVTSTSDLSIAVLIIMMIFYFKQRVHIVETGQKDLIPSPMILTIIQSTILTLLVFLGVLILFFSFEIYRNVRNQNVAINEIHSILTGPNTIIEDTYEN